MQRWQDELTKHPINTTLKQFMDALEANIEFDDPVLATEKARFSKFTNLLRDTLNRLEPDLAPVDLLNQIQSQLQGHGAVDTAKNLLSTKDANQFRTLNDQINPSLSYVTQLRAAVVGKDTKKADTEAASNSLESLVRNISKMRVEYDSAVSAAAAKIEVAETQLTELADESKVVAKEFNENLTQWTTTANGAIALSRKQFAEGLAEIETKSKAQLQTFFSNQNDDAKLKQQELETQLKTIITDAEDKHKKILELYKLVARDSISGGHKQIADREFDDAQWWRWLTIWSIVATALWIGYSLFFMTPLVEPERAFWLQVGKSISLTALLISFVVYASKQAALHRISERKARSFFLQVQAFDPFIERLPEEKQIELKQALITRIFGSDESEHEKAMLENGGFKTIDRAFDIIEKAKKIVGR